MATELWRIVTADTRDELIDIMDGLTAPVLVLARNNKSVNACANKLETCTRTSEHDSHEYVVNTLVYGTPNGDVDAQTARLTGSDGKAIDALLLNVHELRPPPGESMDVDGAEDTVYEVAPPLLLPLAGLAQLVVLGAHRFPFSYLRELADIAISVNKNIDIVLMVYGTDDITQARADRLYEYVIHPTDEEIANSKFSAVDVADDEDVVEDDDDIIVDDDDDE